MSNSISTYKRDTLDTQVIAAEARILISRIIKHIEDDHCKCCFKALSAVLLEVDDDNNDRS